MLKDKDIREPLFDFLESEYARLETQIKDYDKYFDYNIVVVGASHGHHVAEHVPEYWGIITVDEVDEKPDFYFLRHPLPNKKMRINRKLELLWRPELSSLLEIFGMPKYSGQSKPFVRKKIIEWTKLPLSQAEITRIKKAASKAGLEPQIPETRISIEELNYQISELLFERDYEVLLGQINAYRKEHTPRRRGPKKSTRVRRIRRQAKS